MLAIRALKLLATNLLVACDDGKNVKAREAMLLGAMLAGQAFSNAPVAAVHALAYPIGGIFHVPHGLSNALVLPHVLRFNAEAAASLYADIADAVLPESSANKALSHSAKTAALIDWVEQLIDVTGIPKTLREVGVSESDLPRMAKDAMLQTRLLGNNPRPVSESDAFDIYQKAY
jgi:alcohol dehydrogenase